MRTSVFKVSRARRGGFTLVELVIVITIVGILAAVALPRFVAMQRDARIAKAQAIYGAMRSAAGIAKMRCELDINAGGTCTSTAGSITMDGATVDMVNRYPAATDTGIDRATQIVGANDGITIAGGGAAARTYQMVGATTGTTCQISYTAAVLVAAGPPVRIDPPVISLDTAGC